MNRWSCYFATVLIAAMLAALPNGAGAQTCELELKIVDETYSPETAMVRTVNAQSISRQLTGAEVAASDPTTASLPSFDDVISTDRDDYQLNEPFRGVAKFGDHSYGFVVDGELNKTTTIFVPVVGDNGVVTYMESEIELKIPAFDKLYFDLNRNGDLTDDEPIESTMFFVTPLANPDFPLAVSSDFPRVELEVETDGTTYDYAFAFMISGIGNSSCNSAKASFTSASYREGVITVDGEEKTVALVDFNSNGRFDDFASVDPEVHYGYNRVYETSGDKLLIDPQSMSGINPYYVTANKGQYHMGPLIFLGGTLYDVSPSASGETLTIAPSDDAVGYITNPNPSFSATVYNDAYIIKVEGDESGKSLLPVGDWKLLAYTLDWTDVVSEKTPIAMPKNGSLITALGEEISPSIGDSTAFGKTTLSAQGTPDMEAVTVVEGETVEMPFGGPYHSEVTLLEPDGETAYLQMVVVGSQGENLRDMTINGRSPAKPHFTISTLDGIEVATGDFGFG
jgi:hypothetical protein